MNPRTTLSPRIIFLLIAAAVGCGQSPSGDDDVERAQLALTTMTKQVNCGGPALGSFSADTGFSGGATLTRTNTIDMSGVPAGLPMALYQSQRYNNMSYTFSGFTPGTANEIRLHFADTKWTTTNQRRFHVYINDVKVLNEFDIIAAAGAPNKAVMKSFVATASSTGTYVIKWVGTKDAAMVCGIEVGTPSTPNWGMPQLCSGHQTVVSDVQGDVRDIWSGRETAATGKRVGTRPMIKLRFNRAVDPTFLKKAITIKGQVVRKSDGSLTDCRAAAANGGVDNASISVANPVATWTAGTLGATAQRYLYDVQAFVSGSVTGSPKVAGTLAAGGPVTISNFTLDSDAKPYGLISGGKVTLNTGSVGGITTFVGSFSITAAPLPNGLKDEKPIDFASLVPHVQAASAMVAQQPTTGTLAFGSDKIARFTGVRTDNNVFSIDSATLAQAKGITITAPASSSVLVNVVGTGASMSNLTVTLTGPTANKVVWNAPDATKATLTTVTFLGSLVAPKAAVTLTGGTFTGQLVGASLAGTGTLKTATFAGWESFGLTTSDVTVSTTKPLLRACSYTLAIEGPLHSDLSCLGAAFSIPFTVDTGDTSIVSRDNETTRWNASRTQLLSFKPRAGVNTPSSEVLSRYAAPLGIGPQETFTTALNWKTPKAARTTAVYQQQHLGVPVEGGNFLIDQDLVNGQNVARWVRGGAVPVTATVVTPAVSSATAQTTALTTAGAKTPYPWTLSGTKFKAPTTTLLFARNGAARTLAWRVDLSKSGVRSYASVDVDAQTGTVLNTASKAKNAVCGVTAPSTVADATGTVAFPGLGTLTFNDMRLTNGATEARLLRPHTTLVGQPAKTSYSPSMEVFTGARPVDANDNPDPTKLAPVCNANDAWTATDVLDPARALYFVDGVRKFVDAAKLPFKDGLWTGFTGNDATNGVQLRVIPSSHASWGDCPTPNTSCADNVKVPVGPYASYLSSWRVDPYLYINTAFPDPVAGNIDWVQPVPIAHELGHVIIGSARETLGLDNLTPKTEADALGEGFADIMALSFSKSVTPALFSWDLFQGQRNAANPKLNSKPDTYGGTFFCDPVQSASCKPHINATIFDHWFYLMVTGGTGENDLQCTYEVTPPGATEADRFKQALDLAFYAMTTSAGPNPDFASIAEATNGRAMDVVGGGDALRTASEDAWIAVGVLKEPAPKDVSPVDGAKDVAVWPLKLSWTTTDTKTWEVQIASDANFATIVKTADATVISTAGSVRTLGLTTTLDPAVTTYYWRARQKSAKPWGNCLTVFSFTPGDTTKIRLVQPEAPGEDGVYQTNPRADFVWEVLPDIQTYFVKGYASQPASCPAIDDAAGIGTGAAPPGSPTVFMSARTFESRWGLTYDTTSTFYLTIAAMSPDAKSLAPCLIVPFRISQLETPSLLFPKKDDVVQLNGPSTFVAFTPCAGAVEYRVDMGRIKTGGVLEDTFSETKKAADLEQKMNGTQAFVKFPVPITALASTPDDAYWTVWAIDANGFKIHNFSPFVFSNAYHVGPAAPVINTPKNGAIGVSKTSAPVKWEAAGAGPGTTYQVLLFEVGSNGNLTKITEGVAAHSGAVGAVQSTTMSNLADNKKYLVQVVVVPPAPYTAFADVSTEISATAEFTTGGTPPVPATPIVLWDAICEPATPGLGTILNSGNATQFVVADPPKGVAVEIEFRDATDPANLLNGPVTATADMACATTAGGNGDAGLCGPGTNLRECLVTEDPQHFRPMWTAAQEAAAIARARSLWSGFSYQTFRIRYVNDSVNPKVYGAWSRPGVIVACVDKDLCTFEQGTDRITPTNAPDWSSILGSDTLCDDLRYAQQLKGVTSDCIPWH